MYSERFGGANIAVRSQSANRLRCNRLHINFFFNFLLGNVSLQYILNACEGHLESS